MNLFYYKFKLFILYPYPSIINVLKINVKIKKKNLLIKSGSYF